MELELKKEQFACYQALPQLSENREETTETIVPDYLPDIARIVDASGCLFLRSREIADGKAQVSGTVRMTLLYVAEDAQGMKSFEYTLPLDETIEGRTLSGSADSCLDGRLCSCEVRMLNPRKVFTRVNVELTLTPYVPASLSVCSGVKEQEAYKIETLCEKKDIGIIRAIREKDFTFSDEVLLSGTKEPIQELLRTKCALRVTDCKSIGNKIVLKGVARLDAIYLDESGNLASMSSELPFSQILDGLAEEEGETTVRASLRLTGAEIHVGSESEPDNNRAISLRLYISAFTAVREVKSVCCVADLYSTAYDLTALYTSRNAAVRRFLGLEAVVLAAAALVTALLARQMTRPLQILQAASAEIAGGDYDRRTALHTGDELENVSQSFDKMADAVQEKIADLEADVQRREDFVGAFTHELKTPMTSIIGYADMLLSLIHI